MQLHDLLGAGGELEISQLAYDARQVRPGALFFCVPGFTVDGHDFAGQAVENGAVALVVERELDQQPGHVVQVQVEDARAAMATAASRFYGEPSKELAVTGVTGTNGKTTTAFLLRNLLESSGKQTGLLGTVKAIVGGEELPNIRTTPEAIDLQAILRDMVDGGDEACALEISSHALELHRADGIEFAVALFTNLTRDHLDFHDSLEAYFQAKRRLFTMNPKTRIINIDDPYGHRLAGEFSGAIAFGLTRPADYTATDLVESLDGSRFTLRSPDGDFPVYLSLPGRFNVLNLLGAWAAARALGVSADELARAVNQIEPVPGRFQRVDEGQDFLVIVDYAHTPDSLDNVLQTARALTDARVIVTFGCGGDRDRTKRGPMGEIALRGSDLCIVTSDNPRSEDPDAIIAEIVAGQDPRATANVTIEPDRHAAIQLAIRSAQPGDVVVIAGKGHEQGQEFADGVKHPFDDVSVARDALHAILNQPTA